MKFAEFLRATRHHSPLVFLFCFLVTIPAFSIFYYNIRYDFFHSNIAREATFFETEQSLKQNVEASLTLSGKRAAREINEQVAIAFNLFRLPHCPNPDFKMPAWLDLQRYGFNPPSPNRFQTRETAETFKERSDASLAGQAYTMLSGFGFSVGEEADCAFDIAAIANSYSRFDEENLILIYGNSATLYEVLSVAYQDGTLNLDIGYFSQSNIPYYSKEFDGLSEEALNDPFELGQSATWGLIKASSRFPRLKLRAIPAWTRTRSTPDFYAPETIRWPDKMLNLDEYIAEQNIDCPREDEEYCSETRLRQRSVSAIRILGQQDFLSGPASEALTSLYFFENGRDAPLNTSYLRYLYFSTVTVTTLGYGDVVPITTRARVAVALHAVLGILFAGLFLNSLSARLTSRNT